MFAFANGGFDLESYAFENLLQAEAMLVQVCMSLSVAELAFAFEHRKHRSK